MPSDKLPTCQGRSSKNRSSATGWRILPQIVGVNAKHSDMRPAQFNSDGPSGFGAGRLTDRLRKRRAVNQTAMHR